MKYQDNLKQLSQYGVKEADLHKYFADDEYATACMLDQIERISRSYEDVKNIKLHAVNGLIGISFDSNKNKTSMSEKSKNLRAAIKKLETTKKPEYLGYSISVFLGGRDEYEEHYSEEGCFELDIIQSQYHFKYLIRQAEPAMSNSDLEYFSDLLTEFSNHPFTACQKMGFCFYRKTTALDVQLRLAKEEAFTANSKSTKSPE